MVLCFFSSCFHFLYKAGKKRISTALHRRWGSTPPFILPTASFKLEHNFFPMDEGFGASRRAPPPPPHDPPLRPTATGERGSPLKIDLCIFIYVYIKRVQGREGPKSLSVVSDPVRAVSGEGGGRRSRRWK